MKIGEILAAVWVLLLALYGCAGLMRRVCLWLFSCSRCAHCYRIAVPDPDVEMEPLLRCLQSQTVWDDLCPCHHTLLLLPDEWTASDEEAETMLRQAPAVIPVTANDLVDMIRTLSQKL